MVTARATQDQENGCGGSASGSSTRLYVSDRAVVVAGCQYQGAILSLAERMPSGNVGGKARRRHEHEVVDVVADVCDDHVLVACIRQVIAIQDVGSPNCMPERSESCSEAISARSRSKMMSTAQTAARTVSPKK